MGKTLGLPGGGRGVSLSNARSMPGHAASAAALRSMARSRIFLDQISCCAGDRIRAEPIIIFRIGSLGDTVVALPCFHQIARSFPNSRRILVTNIAASQKAPPTEAILADSGLVDGVIHLPASPRTLRGLLKLRQEIRATKAKTLVYVADRNVVSTLRDLAFFRWCGIRRVIGAPVAGDLRRPRVDRATGCVEFEAARLARCLAPLGQIDLDNPAVWDLRLRPDEIVAAEMSLMPVNERNFVAVNIGGKVARKDWGDDNWTTLFRLMAVRYADLALVFFGSADEFDRSRGLAVAWPNLRLNLCGRLAPRESAAAMRNALFFVGHDSGPLHLAAAAGVPCVGIFGNLNEPKWWHPIGKRHRIIHDMRGVRYITPEAVYAAIGSIVSSLSERTAKRAARAGA
jgi:heptosyltransferase-3